MDSTLGDRKFLFVLGSARTGGNTETLARTAAAQLPPSVAREWVWLAEVGLPRFEDHRHAETEWPAVTPAEQALLDATLAATDLVIASPLYWYSVSATTKLYLDYWSRWMRLPGVDFVARMAGKTMWTVTALSDEPATAEPLIGTLKLSADYLKMKWGGVLLGDGSKPGDVLTDTAALTAAKTFFTA